ncbi:hypothetical protein PV762_14215 [Mitsuaria sp. CC2]
MEIFRLWLWLQAFRPAPRRVDARERVRAVAGILTQSDLVAALARVDRL